MARRILSSQQRVLTLFLATALAITGAFATTSGVAAAAPTTTVVVPLPSPVLPENGLHLTDAQVVQLNQSIGFLAKDALWTEFSGVNGALTLKDPLPTLQAKYNLSAAQVQTIQSILTFDKHRAATTSKPTSTRGVSPMLSTNWSVVYFTFSDVGGLLITAALAGPWALLATLDVIASMFGGPIGTIIMTVLGAIGIGTLTNLAYIIVQGYFKHQGTFFGIAWTPFPNYVAGNWCGCN